MNQNVFQQILHSFVILFAYHKVVIKSDGISVLNILFYHCSTYNKQSIIVKLEEEEKTKLSWKSVYFFFMKNFFAYLSWFMIFVTV